MSAAAPLIKHNQHTYIEVQAWKWDYKCSNQTENLKKKREKFANLIWAEYGVWTILSEQKHDPYTIRWLYVYKTDVEI